MIHIEETDPYGKYNVISKVRDNIAGIELTLERGFQVVKIVENIKKPLEIKSESDLDFFLTYYYQSPMPELIGESIQYIGTNKILYEKNTQPPIVAFYCCIFTANKSKKDEWLSIVRKQDKVTKNLLLKVLFTQSKDLFKNIVISPTLNDMYWGAFFATGDIKFVDKIVDNMEYFNESKDFLLFSASASAKWSLASNARQHPIVRQQLEDIHKSLKPPLKIYVAEILEKEVETISREVKLSIEKAIKERQFKNMP